MGLGPVWPKAHLARDVKRSKPIYHIKIGGALLDGRIQKLVCESRGVSPNARFEVSHLKFFSPPAGHPFVYDKIVINRLIKVGNTQRVFIRKFPSFQITYFSKE